MERLTPRLSYQVECYQARNAEEALLAVLSSCSTKTQKLSTINWGNPNVFRRWVDRLRGQQVDRYVPLAFLCLVKLNLGRCNLDGATLVGANLSGATFNCATLIAANLYGANLYRANLYGANLCGANLYGANLFETNLDGASLDGANLFEANLNGANLNGVSLDEANLDGISWNDRTSWNNISGLENAIDVPKALKQLLSQNTPRNEGLRIVNVEGNGRAIG